MKVYDFRCPCGIVKERFVRSELDDVKCDCGQTMTRLLAAPGMVKTNFADKTGFKNRKPKR